MIGRLKSTARVDEAAGSLRSPTAPPVADVRLDRVTPGRPSVPASFVAPSMSRSAMTISFTSDAARSRTIERPMIPARPARRSARPASRAPATHPACRALKRPPMRRCGACYRFVKPESTLCSAGRAGCARQPETRRRSCSLAQHDNCLAHAHGAARNRYAVFSGRLSPSRRSRRTTICLGPRISFQRGDTLNVDLPASKTAEVGGGPPQGRADFEPRHARDLVWLSPRERI